MGRFPAGKLRLWVGQPVNAPFVTPPFSLRLTLVLCIVSVTSTLVYAVATQLRMGFSLSAAQMIFVAVLYFVLPVLIAHTIAVNRWFSRPLLVLYAFAVGFQCAGWILKQSWPLDYRIAAALGVGAGLVGIVVWLYGTPKMRVYYALITGAALPDDLDRRADEILAPGKLERVCTRLFQAVAPRIEQIAVILIIITVLLAWASMQIDWL